MCLIEYYHLTAQADTLVNNWQHEARYCLWKCSRNRFTASFNFLV